MGFLIGEEEKSAEVKFLGEFCQDILLDRPHWMMTSAEMMKKKVVVQPGII